MKTGETITRTERQWNCETMAYENVDRQYTVLRVRRSAKGLRVLLRSEWGWECTIVVAG